MAVLIVVMGVSGSGKSTIARRLAERLGIDFCEGDDLHPPANIAKMADGRPLSDADRLPWLDAVNHWLRAHRDRGGVASCSALRRCYRDRLRLGLEPPPAFVLLDPPPPVLRRRLSARPFHFMPATLLDSQLATLERPTAEEGAIVLPGDECPDTVVDDIVDRLSRAGRPG